MFQASALDSASGLVLVIR